MTGMDPHRPDRLPPLFLHFRSELREDGTVEYSSTNPGETLTFSIPLSPATAGSSSARSELHEVDLTDTGEPNEQ